MAKYENPLSHFKVKVPERDTRMEFEMVLASDSTLELGMAMATVEEAGGGLLSMDSSSSSLGPP